MSLVEIALKYFIPKFAKKALQYSIETADCLENETDPIQNNYLIIFGELKMSDTFMRIMPDDSLPSGVQILNLVPKEAFTTDDQTELDQLYFATGDEKILTGVWECAPCKSEYDSYPVHEMMSVISGSVTLTNNKGISDTFTAGDVFFIPKGTQCTWHITEKLRKYYMIAS